MMAALASRLLVFVLLGLTSVTAVEIIRRQNQEQQVRLDSAGHVILDDPALADPKEALVKTKGNNKGSSDVPTQCDRQFLQMAEGSDECTGSGSPQTIEYEGDCTHAASVLGFTKAPNYFLNNYVTNPLTYPKGCFLNTSTKLIHFNPEESDTKGMTLSGKKICMRTIYINGTEHSDPSDGCTGDAVSILNYDACWAASVCAAGGGACKLQPFKDNVTSYKRQDKPQGCFRDDIGCWGFNYLETPAGGDIVNGTPVCKNVVSSGGGASTSAPPS